MASKMQSSFFHQLTKAQSSEMFCAIFQVDFKVIGVKNFFLLRVLLGCYCADGVDFS